MPRRRRSSRCSRGHRTALPREAAPPRATRRAPKSTSGRVRALDDGNEATLDQAAALYRKALECDPYLVAGLINLANIHYTQHEIVEAQALYERAIGLEADFFEAHFNLGNIHHDLGEFEEARRCYDEALDASTPITPTRTSTWLSRSRRWVCRRRPGRTGGPTSSSRRRVSGSSWRASSPSSTMRA